ncbi:MAG: hypothetical protein K7J46_17015 [Bryobacter sp.]|jgi:hypothetical protein|nr:hypothetical protein [Bryobacter sp. CoA8 C33]
MIFPATSHLSLAPLTPPARATHPAATLWTEHLTPQALAHPTATCIIRSSHNPFHKLPSPPKLNHTALHLRLDAITLQVLRSKLLQ